MFVSQCETKIVGNVVLSAVVPNKQEFMHFGQICVILLASCASGQSLTSPLRAWIDSDTGHRVIRLTDEPNSASLYFNQNAYTPDGKKMVYTTPNGISVLDLSTLETKSVVMGRVRI